MYPTPKPFQLGRRAAAAIVGCFLAGCLLANVLPAESSATNSVPVWPFKSVADNKPPAVRHADRVSNGTDDFSRCAADESIPIRDVHATLLNLLGLDDEHLTYHHAGCIRRLTDIRAHVLKRIIA